MRTESLLKLRLARSVEAKDGLPAQKAAAHLDGFQNRDPQLEEDPQILSKFVLFPVLFCILFLTPPHEYQLMEDRPANEGNATAHEQSHVLFLAPPQEITSGLDLQYVVWRWGDLGTGCGTATCDSKGGACAV